MQATLILTERSLTDPANSSLLILAAMVLLVVLAFIFYVLGGVQWAVSRVLSFLRGMINTGFGLWQYALSWAPWPIFLFLILGLIVAGWWQVEEIPAVAIVLGSATMLMGMITTFAYIYLDLERHEVVRGYKAIHNPLKGQEPARDLARYGYRLWSAQLAAAAVGVVGGFALLNQGLYWSIATSWYSLGRGNGTFADFLVYALLSLYRILDLLDLANHYRVVHLSHVQPVRWPATTLLTGFKTFVTLVLLEQIVATIRKRKLLGETINDFFSPHQPIHERARHALPQYGTGAVEPLLRFLRAAPLLTKEQREQFPRILADIGSHAIDTLLAQLHDPNDQIRAIAVTALGYLQATQALPYLTGLQTDSSESVRYAVVEALGNILKPGVRSVRKTHRFLIWRKTSSRMLWVWFPRRKIKPVGDPISLVVSQLQSALADSSAGVRAMAVRTLGLLGKSAAPVVNDLLPLLQDTEETVRLGAAETLKEIQPEPAIAIPALIPLLGDSSSRVKVGAIKSLSSFGEQSERIVAVLVTLLQDRDETVRQAVIEAIGKTGTISSVSMRQLIEGLTSTDPLVRARTAEALGAIGEPACSLAPNLVKVAQDENDHVRAEAVKALGKLGESAAPVVLPNLVRALHDPDTWVQALAAEALGEMGQDADEAVPPLIRALRHGNAQVRANAAEALGKLGLVAAPSANALEGATRDDDAGVRVHAMRALGEIGHVLPGILCRACRDPDTEVKLAALAVATRLETWDSELRVAVIDLLNDTNDQVRVESARVLTKAMGADPALLARLTRMVGEETSVWVTEQLVVILGRLGPAATAAGPTLVQAALTAELCVREAALKALVQIQATETPTALIECLKDNSPDIRMIASAGWWKATTIPEEAIGGLVAALHDPEIRVRANVAYSLSRLDVLPEAAEPLLLECVKDPNDELRLNALLALQKSQSNILATVFEHLLSDTVPRIRLLAAGSLLLLVPHHAQARQAVLAILGSPSVALRRAVLALFRSLGANQEVYLSVLRERVLVEEELSLREEMRTLIKELEASQRIEPAAAHRQEVVTAEQFPYPPAQIQ